MADFITVIAEMVCAAVVQEAVSRTVSLVLGKRKKKASQGRYLERLRKAAKEVEFVLEWTAKMPITEVSLLRDRIELKRHFVEAALCLLSSSKHHKKRQVTQGQQEISQAVTRSSPQGLATRPALFSVSSLVAMGKDDLCLSCDDVKRFEQFAESARIILGKVESGCSLRHRMSFSSPLVRHLFEGKTLIYQAMHADEGRGFYMWPSRLEEDRGVEVAVGYLYLHCKRPEKSFILFLSLRLSESTDIVGVAMNCLQSLESQFNFVAGTAMGELTVLASLQDVPHSYSPPCVGFQEWYTECEQMWRPDPVCCGANGQGSYLTLPEQVNYVYLKCYISVPEMRSSFDEGAGQRPNESVVTAKLIVHLAPHFVPEEQPHTSYAVEEIGDNKEERIDIITTQLGDIVRSNAINCFLRQPQETEYSISWGTKHGVGRFSMRRRKHPKRWCTQPLHQCLLPCPKQRCSV